MTTLIVNLTENATGHSSSYPAANGEVRDYSSFCTKAHEKGILVTAYCDLLALVLLKEPAAWCRHRSRYCSKIQTPNGLRGPTAGYIATSDAFKRNIPGRIVGISVDRHGNPAVRLALQTREQHIKERATSNICTATALMATMSGMFAVYHGPEGIRGIAKNAYGYAHAVADVLRKNGYKLAAENFFDTIEIIGAEGIEFDPEQINSRAERGINFCTTPPTTP